MLEPICALISHCLMNICESHIICKIGDIHIFFILECILECSLDILHCPNRCFLELIIAATQESILVVVSIPDHDIIVRLRKTATIASSSIGKI